VIRAREMKAMRFGIDQNNDGWFHWRLVTASSVLG
jgi:uncharacterized protein YegP (UPF0339 family)